jgi:carboxyl-terminal processing protease
MRTLVGITSLSKANSSFEVYGEWLGSLLSTVGKTFSALGFLFMLAACNSVPIQPTQPPEQYLNNALDWIETHEVLRDRVDWAQVRQEATDLASGAQTTAQMHLALEHVLDTLCYAGDSYAFLYDPETPTSGKTSGIMATYTDGVIVQVSPGSPAERAGIQVGDTIVTLNGKPYAEIGDPCNRFRGIEKEKIVIRRKGEKDLLVFQLSDESVHLPEPTGRSLGSPWEKIGYLELTVDTGAELYSTYPTRVQNILRSVDQSHICGWIIDLRRLSDGDLWSYLAGVGPLLGEGELGGFVYLDGSRDTWAYRDGKIYWGDEQRYESYVRGSIYQLKNPAPAVALLTSETTREAGELVGIAFRGRPDVRFFGEPTAGLPFLSIGTPLSDGATIYLSAARSYDRLGNEYAGPLVPDETLATDWLKIGSNQDPLIHASADWLQTTPGCVTQEDNN